MRVNRKWTLIVLGLAVAAMVLARTFSGPVRGAPPPDGASGMTMVPEAEEVWRPARPEHG